MYYHPAIAEPPAEIKQSSAKSFKSSSHHSVNEKVLRGVQTLHAGCSKASQKLSPRRVGWPKSNQLEMVTTFTYKPSLVGINAHNFLSYCGNIPTLPARQPQTGAITIHCATAQRGV